MQACVSFTEFAVPAQYDLRLIALDDLVASVASLAGPRIDLHGDGLAGQYSFSDAREHERW